MTFFINKSFFKNDLDLLNKTNRQTCGKNTKWTIIWHACIQRDAEDTFLPRWVDVPSCDAASVMGRPCPLHVDQFLKRDPRSLSCHTPSLLSAKRHGTAVKSSNWGPGWWRIQLVTPRPRINELLASICAFLGRKRPARGAEAIARDRHATHYLWSERNAKSNEANGQCM